MVSYETFKKRNINFGEYGRPSEKEMQRNYEIAMQVEKTYNENFPNTTEPQIGDIVEFADEYHVYTDGKIVENLYGSTDLCICERGGSFTNGKSFSTSGGAFIGKDKKLLQYVGEAENYVWTWGCYGAGAHQGIYFPLKVRKWVIPYDPKQIKRSTIYFKRNDEDKIISVGIENSGSLYNCKTFDSVKAFEAWAQYVGYAYHMDGDRGYSHQKVSDKCWTNTLPKPEGGKPIKVLANGRVHDGLVISEDFTITEWWPNIYDPTQPQPRFGTPEYEKERAEYRKYSGNPLGV